MKKKLEADVCKDQDEINEMEKICNRRRGEREVEEKEKVKE